MTDYKLRGLTIFVSVICGLEYKYLNTATLWTDSRIDCDEGEIVWLKKSELLQTSFPSHALQTSNFQTPEH